MSTASPTVTATVTGAAVAWTDHANAKTSDNSHATSVLSTANPASNPIRVTGFDFSAITEEVAIDGITVNVEGKTGGIGVTFLASAQLVLGGAVLGELDGTNKTLSAGDATHVYGGGTTGWGANLTGAIVTDSTFGVQVVAGWTSGAGPTASIDHIEIVVTWHSVAGIKRSRVSRNKRRR